MAADYTNPFFGQANPFLGKDNPYLTDKINQAQGDLVRNFNLTTQPAYNSAMVNSGSFGNAGVQQMNENAQRNLQQSLGDISTNMRGQDYDSQKQLYLADRAQNIGNYQWDQNFNRSLFNDAYAQNMGNLQAGVGLLGTMAGYNANDLTNGTTIQNTPLNYWSQFANMANGIANGFGSSTSTQSGGGTNPLMAGLGGAQLGNAFMNSWNSGSTAPPSGYSSWGAYNYGNNGGGDSLGSFGSSNGWW